MILDTGDRTPMGNTGFVRDSHEGKGRMDLIPWMAIMELSKHCEEGALKYGERNIDRGCPQHSLIDSALRHLAKYLEGWTDEDHLRAALWNIAWAVQQDVLRPDMQDIPSRNKPPRCVENTCYYNNNCVCTADIPEPLKGTDCKSYMED